MAKLPACRLLLETEPNSGAWNMAVDEALLNTAATGHVATFRWYRWREPTLSLGYFQQPAELDADPRWVSIPKVRRLTGGGAILHHHEWTYSFAVPPAQPLVRRPEELYDLVHAAIIAMLATHGVLLSLRGAVAKQSPEPLLCFSRADAHDVVRQNHKVLGSAQRRRRGAILQHGSLLMHASPLTPDHLGLDDLGFAGELTDRELIGVVERLALQVETGGLTPEEAAAAKALARL